MWIFWSTMDLFRKFGSKSPIRQQTFKLFFHYACVFAFVCKQLHKDFRNLLMLSGAQDFLWKAVQFSWNSQPIFKMYKDKGQQIRRDASRNWFFLRISLFAVRCLFIWYTINNSVQFLHCRQKYHCIGEEQEKNASLVKQYRSNYAFLMLTAP